jgi:hypothetical protein
MKIMDVIVESYNEDVIEKVIKGFNLIPTKYGFGKAYTTSNDKPTIELKHSINKWIEKHFKDASVKIDIEKNTRTFNFHTKNNNLQKQHNG